MFGDFRLLTTAQVAAIFRRKPAWWSKAGRARLEARGFPPPVATGLYDARAVDAWLLLQMPPELRSVTEDGRAADAEAAQLRERVNMREKLDRAADRAIAGMRRRRRA